MRTLFLEKSARGAWHTREKCKLRAYGPPLPCLLFFETKNRRQAGTHLFCCDCSTSGSKGLNREILWNDEGARERRHGTARHTRREAGLYSTQVLWTNPLFRPFSNPWRRDRTARRVASIFSSCCISQRRVTPLLFRSGSTPSALGGGG